jgi:putative transposase
VSRAILSSQSNSGGRQKGRNLVISDANDGFNAAVGRLTNASWRRRRVHFVRTVLADSVVSGQRVVSALNAAAFAQGDATGSR